MSYALRAGEQRLWRLCLSADCKEVINLLNTIFMKKTKCLYEAPTTDVLVLRIEENIMSGDGTWEGSLGKGTTWAENAGEDYGLE